MFNNLGNARSLPARSCLVRLRAQCYTGVTFPSGDRSRDSGRAGAAHLPVPPGSGHVTTAQAAGPSARVGLRRLAVRGPGGPPAGLCSCEPCCVRRDQRSAACAAGPTGRPRGPACPEIAPVLRITCVVSGDCSLRTRKGWAGVERVTGVKGLKNMYNNE